MVDGASIRPPNWPVTPWFGEPQHDDHDDFGLWGNATSSGRALRGFFQYEPEITVDLGPPWSSMVNQKYGHDSCFYWLYKHTNKPVWLINHLVRSSYSDVRNCADSPA